MQRAHHRNPRHHGKAAAYQAFRRTILDPFKRMMLPLLDLDPVLLPATAIRPITMLGHQTLEVNGGTIEPSFDVCVEVTIAIFGRRA
jgi:hypothetical protein